jgi:hypothetical protein
VNYHLKELERDGLVELVEERKKGNCLERVVKRAARSYLVGAEALGAIASEVVAEPDRFSSTWLVARLARALTDVATLQREAEEAQKKLATFTLEVDVRFADAASRSAFLSDLASHVAKLAAKYHDEDAPRGRSTRLLIAGLPAIPAAPHPEARPERREDDEHDEVDEHDDHPRTRKRAKS